MADTERTRLDDEALDALFATARAQAPEPGADLLARIMADADTQIAAHAASAPTARRHRYAGRWAAFIGGIGGWPALASMATAAVAGIWMGFASPAQLNTLTDTLLFPNGASSAADYELEDLLPGYDGFESLAEEVQG